MTEKTIYVANDGKEFEDEYECNEYELNLMLSSSTLKMYDSAGHLTNKVDDMYVFDAPTVEDLNTMNDLLDEYRITSLPDDAQPDTFFWWEYGGEWKTIESYEYKWQSEEMYQLALKIRNKKESEALNKLIDGGIKI